jgi:hypothetical protein
VAQTNQGTRPKPVEVLADHRNRDRQHPDQGQTEHRVQSDLPGEAPEGIEDQGAAEDEEHRETQRLANVDREVSRVSPAPP